MTTPQMPDCYSSFERRFLAPGRQLILTALKPIVISLAAMGISPNMVSLSQLIVGGVIALIVDDHPRVAFSLFIFAILLDGLDGSLARYTGRCSRFGAILDGLCDHVREILMVAALARTGTLDPFRAALYAFVYPAFNLTLFLCNYHQTPLPLALKSYLVVYPALFLHLWWGINWLDEAVALSTALMGIVIAQGLMHLRRVLGDAPLAER